MLAVFAALLPAPALGAHSYPATYNGSVGVGTLEFEVRSDGMAVTRFQVTTVNTTCGTISVTSSGTYAITGHAFSYQPTYGLRFSGTFDSTQHATGTIQYRSTVPACTSSVINWEATTSTPPPTQCGDGIDNDGDGKIDLADPGCSSPSDNDEFDAPPAPMPCSDGVDNDFDGLVDMADPGCAYPSDVDEFNFPTPPGPTPPGPTPPGPTPTPTPSPTPTPTAPSLPLTVSIPRTLPLTTTLSKGVPVTVSCPRACSAASTAVLGAKLARQLKLGKNIGSGSMKLAATGQRSFRVKFTRKAQNALRRLKNVSVTVRTKVTQSTGSKVFTRTVALSRATRANRPPVFPSPLQSTRKTNFEYDDAGRLAGGTTTITVTTPATDADGDPIIYSWTASIGPISNNGLTATWTRIMDMGQFHAGAVTVTASDGRGGTDSFTWEFQRGAG